MKIRVLGRLAGMIAYGGVYKFVDLHIGLGLLQSLALSVVIYIVLLSVLMLALFAIKSYKVRQGRYDYLYK